jgi:hypothetical protein
MSKTITVKKHNDYYFYKALNVFSEGLANDISNEAHDWITNNRRPLSEEVYPPEASIGSYQELKDHIFWSGYYKEIEKHIAKYCKVAGIDISTVTIDESWMTKVDDIEIEGKHTKEELRRRLSQHNTFGNMHSHSSNQIGVVYYAKNPNPKYGTLIKLSDNQMFKNDGEENSLLIFNPQQYHTAIYPTLEEIKTCPRITIVVDCIME